LRNAFTYTNSDGYLYGDTIAHSDSYSYSDGNADPMQ
jgi:hypothetical protein